MGTVRPLPDRMESAPVPAWPLPATDPRERKTPCPHRNLGTNVQSSITHKSQRYKQPECPPDDWISKRWSNHTVEDYTAVKGNAVLIGAATRMKLGNVMLGESSQTQRATWCISPFIRKARKRQSQSGGKQLSGCQGLGGSVGRLLAGLRFLLG